MGGNAQNDSVDLSSRGGQENHESGNCASSECGQAPPRVIVIGERAIPAEVTEILAELLDRTYRCNTSGSSRNGAHQFHLSEPCNQVSINASPGKTSKSSDEGKLVISQPQRTRIQGSNPTQIAPTAQPSGQSHDGNSHKIPFPWIDEEEITPIIARSEKPNVAPVNEVAKGPVTAPVLKKAQVTEMEMEILKNDAEPCESENTPLVSEASIRAKFTRLEGKKCRVLTLPYHHHTLNPPKALSEVQPHNDPCFFVRCWPRLPKLRNSFEQNGLMQMKLIFDAFINERKDNPLRGKLLLPHQIPGLLRKPPPPVSKAQFMAQVKESRALLSGVLIGRDTSARVLKGTVRPPLGPSGSRGPLAIGNESEVFAHILSSLQLNGSLSDEAQELSAVLTSSEVQEIVPNTRNAPSTTSQENMISGTKRSRETKNMGPTPPPPPCTQPVLRKKLTVKRTLRNDSPGKKQKTVNKMTPTKSVQVLESNKKLCITPPSRRSTTQKMNNVAMSTAKMATSQESRITAQSSHLLTGQSAAPSSQNEAFTSTPTIATAQGSLVSAPTSQLAIGQPSASSAQNAALMSTQKIAKAQGSFVSAPTSQLATGPSPSSSQNAAFTSTPTIATAQGSLVSEPKSQLVTWQPAASSCQNATFMSTQKIATVQGSRVSDSTSEPATGQPVASTSQNEAYSPKRNGANGTAPSTLTRTTQGAQGTLTQQQQSQAVPWTSLPASVTFPDSAGQQAQSSTQMQTSGMLQNPGNQRGTGTAQLPPMVPLSQIPVAPVMFGHVPVGQGPAGQVALTQLLAYQTSVHQLAAGQIPAEQVTTGQVTPGQIAPGQIVPGQIVPGQIVPGQIVPGHIVHGQIVHGHIVPGHIIPGPIVPGQVVHGHIVPGQIMPGQIVPGQIVPGQIVPGQVIPMQTPPGQVAPCQAASERVASGQAVVGQAPISQVPVQPIGSPTSLAPPPYGVPQSRPTSAPSAPVGSPSQQDAPKPNNPSGNGSKSKSLSPKTKDDEAKPKRRYKRRGSLSDDEAKPRRRYKRRGSPSTGASRGRKRTQRQNQVDGISVGYVTPSVPRAPGAAVNGEGSAKTNLPLHAGKASPTQVNGAAISPTSNIQAHVPFTPGVPQRTNRQLSPYAKVPMTPGEASFVQSLMDKEQINTQVAPASESLATQRPFHTQLVPEFSEVPQALPSTPPVLPRCSSVAQGSYPPAQEMDQGNPGPCSPEMTRNNVKVELRDEIKPDISKASQIVQSEQAEPEPLESEQVEPYNPMVTITGLFPGRLPLGLPEISPSSDFIAKSEGDYTPGKQAFASADVPNDVPSRSVKQKIGASDFGAKPPLYPPRVVGELDSAVGKHGCSPSASMDEFLLQNNELEKQPNNAEASAAPCGEPGFSFQDSFLEQHALDDGPSGQIAGMGYVQPSTSQNSEIRLLRLSIDDDCIAPESLAGRGTDDLLADMPQSFHPGTFPGGNG